MMVGLDGLWKSEGLLPWAGLGFIALAVPFVFPALRPQFASVLKAGAKLFLEAELGADNALADRLVDASIDALMKTASQGSEDERKHKAAHEVNRFVSAARASARRRGWDAHDAHRRYHRHLAKLNAALSHARHRAKPAQRSALSHASDQLSKITQLENSEVPQMRAPPDVHPAV